MIRRRQVLEFAIFDCRCNKGFDYGLDTDEVFPLSVTDESDLPAGSAYLKLDRNDPSDIFQTYRLLASRRHFP
jgi:hypothetical protein